MPVPFWATVHGIVLGTSMCLIIFSGAITLQTFHYGQSHQRCQIRVFSISFHASPPTRITVYIDIRSPKRQSFVTIPFTLTLKIMVFGTGFIRYDAESFMNCLIIKSGSKSYRLRKNCCFSGACHSVQCFIPPVICRYSKAFNGWRAIFHLADFLFQSHTFQQVPRPFGR